MKREFLQELKLDDATIEKIMAENGKDIEREKAKFADYDGLKEQLKKANETIDGFKDYDQTKAEVEEYKAESEKHKAEAQKARDEATAKIAQLELQAKVKDFTGGKKFVNDFTRNAINSALEAELNKAENKGRSLDELFKAVTDGKENVLQDDNAPTPPTVAGMVGGGTTTLDEQNAARAVMGLPPKEK